MSITRVCNIIRDGDVEELKEYLKYKNPLNDKWHIYASIESANSEMCNFVIKQIKQNYVNVYKKLCETPDIFFFLLDSKEFKEHKMLSLGKVLLNYFPKPDVNRYNSTSIMLVEKEEKRKNINRVFELAKCVKRKGKYDCVNRDICQTIYEFL